MNLTNEIVECLLTGTEASLPIGMPMSKDICEDNLAMRKMLEQIEREQRICHWCGAVLQDDMIPEDRRHGSECELKELLG